LVGWAILSDMALGITLVYASFWVYEMGNLAAFYAAGAHPQLVVQGILPLGVFVGAAVSAGLLVKVVQTVLVIGFFLLPFRYLRHSNMSLAKISLAVILSCYGSSLGWEMLGFWTRFPYWANPLTFLLLSVAVAALLTKRTVLNPIQTETEVH